MTSASILGCEKISKGYPVICESYDSHVIRCEYFSVRIFLFAANHMFCESCESSIRMIRKNANYANHMIRNDSHDSQIRLYANHMIRKNANHNANHTFLENNIIPNFFNLSIFLSYL